MARRRIAVLLGGAVVVGLGIVAFFQATQAWSFATTVFVPAACALAAVVGILRGRAAPFSIGFAVCGAMLMLTVFPWARPDRFASLSHVMFDREYASTLPEHEQEWYYERVANQVPVVGATVVLGVAAVAGAAASFLVPPILGRLERRFSVRRLMIAVVVVAVALAFGRAEYRNFVAEQRRHQERSRVIAAVDKSVVYGQILHEGGIAMFGYEPREDGVCIATSDGEISDRIAEVLVRCDLRSLILNSTKVPESADRILRKAFNYFDHTDSGGTRSYARQNVDGLRAPGMREVVYVQTGLFGSGM